MQSPLSIRAATPADAEAIGELAQQFADYLRGLGDQTEFGLNARTYWRDGFGANPAFAGLVAAYLLYYFGYDADHAHRLMHVGDLYVQESACRHGAGRALMQAAAKRCREAGGRGLLWTVYKPNNLTLTFYEHLGAEYVQNLEFMYWPV